MIQEYKNAKVKTKTRPYNLRSRTTMANISCQKMITTCYGLLMLSTAMAAPSLSRVGTQVPNLGKLYDCSRRKMVTVVDNPSIDYCQDMKNVTRVFSAEVYEFEQAVRTIPIYHCFLDPLTGPMNPVPSVRLSVCPSVTQNSHTSHHRIS